MATAPAILPILSVTASNAIGWRHEPEVDCLPLGLPSLDAPAGGFPRGRITEIAGAASSGRTTVLHRVLSTATRRGEYCAVVDGGNAFDPRGAAEAGTDLDALVWVRCSGNLEHAVKAADLLIHGGGFGVVALDLCDIPARELRKIPLSWWYRFRRAVEGTETILLLIEREPMAKACASLMGEMSRQAVGFAGARQFQWLACGRFRFAARKPARPAPAPELEAAALDMSLHADY